MESSLHRELKQRYAAAAGGAQVEARWGSFRIDVLTPGELIEVQLASLSALKQKLPQLLADRPVRVVKPIVRRKMLVKRSAASGPVVQRRRSPRLGQLIELFDELVYLTGQFPHPGLTLEVLLVDIEEWRHPPEEGGLGSNRRRRRRPAYIVEDQKLVSIEQTLELRTADDLRKLLPARLPRPFHTGHLAEALEVPRWVAQRIAYCLRHAGTAREVGKAGNARLYRFAPRRRAA